MLFRSHTHTQYTLAHSLAHSLPYKVQLWATKDRTTLGATSEEWQRDEELKRRVGQEVLADFRRIGQVQGFEDYEVPRGIVIDFRPWNIDNGFLVGMGKVNRPKVKETYHLAIDLEYNRLQETGH